MSLRNPTQEDIKQGFKTCETCGSLLLLEAGFEVNTSACVRCGEHVASKEEFFNVPAEI